MGSGPSPLSWGVFLPLPLLQAFLLLIAGRVSPLLPSPASLFVYNSHGKWVFPSLLWSFPPTTTFTSFPAPGCWACALTLTSPARLVYLQFCEGFPSPPLRCSGCPTLFATCLMLLLLIIRFLFFSLVGVGLSRRLC
jgi:hypothetical protein